MAKNRRLVSFKTLAMIIAIAACFAILCFCIFDLYQSTQALPPSEPGVAFLASRTACAAAAIVFLKRVIQRQKQHFAG